MQDPILTLKLIGTNKLFDQTVSNQLCFIGSNQSLVRCLQVSTLDGEKAEGSGIGDIIAGSGSGQGSGSGDGELESELITLVSQFCPLIVTKHLVSNNKHVRRFHL